MKKITLALVLILVTVMIWGCTQTSNERVDEKDNTQIQVETAENSKGEEMPVKENSVDNDTTEGETEDKSVRDNISVIDIATAKNETDYSYQVNLKEGDNGRLIPTIVINDGEGKEIQKITYQSEFDEMWYNMYVENGGEICRFVDFNFDGYPDVVTQLYGAMVNQWYKVWLYNPKTKEFENSEEYETQINPQINTDKKYVLSTRYDKGIPNYELSHVEDGHLAYLGSITGEIDNGGKVTFIQRMYGYLNDKGELAYHEVQTYEEITSLEDLDELWSAFEIKLIQ